MAQRGNASTTSLALRNLRGVVIVIVLAFHAMLAYLQWNPAKPAAFDSPPYAWRAFPIIDSSHFFGFDLFCAWQDVYLMSLMFFLSGLFVWPSLQRKNRWGFLRDRLLRLGLPYLFGILILIPIATYPAYAVTGANPSLSAYYDAWRALPFLPIGPLWFLGQLLIFDVAITSMHWLAPGAVGTLGRWSAKAEDKFTVYFAVLLAVSALAYVPLAIAFTPWAWSASGPFAIQFCRPLLYAVYFLAGVALGATDIERGLLRTGGFLARHWARWLAAALASLFLWMGLTDLTINGYTSIPVQLASDLGFVLACATGCFFVIAASLRFATRRSRLLDSLSSNAYGLYLVHYDFVVWLQFALLATALFAAVKAAIVFALTLLLSWGVVLAAQRIPFGALLIGATSRRAAPAS